MICVTFRRLAVIDYGLGLDVIVYLFTVIAIYSSVLHFGLF